MRLRILKALVLGATAACAPLAAADDTGNAPTGAIERHYAAPGPWQVVAEHALGCCDDEGFAFDAWYPANLGEGGVTHPIIAWGNGTGASPELYAHFLAHLASWGFVVIASHNPNTGTGAPLTAAVRWLMEAADDPDSRFHGVLDVDAIGVAGHSQGATGALNALADASQVDTAVTLELPAQRWCSSPAYCADSRALTHGTVFYINGSQDQLISPSWQARPWAQAGLQGHWAWFDATPAALDSVWATLIGPGHNDIQGQPDCGDIGGCNNGVYGFLGYPTAWFRAQLGQDPQALRAFVAPAGELFRQPHNWTNVHSTLRR